MLKKKIAYWIGRLTLCPLVFFGETRNYLLLVGLIMTPFLTLLELLPGSGHPLKADAQFVIPWIWSMGAVVIIIGLMWETIGRPIFRHRTGAWTSLCP